MNETTSNVTGRHIGGTFDLVDHHGHEVNERTYRGTYAVIFFGFTHCKMVCPVRCTACRRYSTAWGRSPNAFSRCTSPSTRNGTPRR